MHIVCPSIFIPASTELTEILYISCRQKLPHPLSTAPLLAPGAYAPCHLPAATVYFSWLFVQLAVNNSERFTRITNTTVKHKSKV